MMKHTHTTTGPVRPLAALRAASRAAVTPLESLERRTLFAVLTVAPSGAMFTDPQLAINAAQNDDVVQIAPGTYNIGPYGVGGGNLLSIFDPNPLPSVKRITVRGADPATTIINVGADAAAGLLICNGSGSVIENLTINGGLNGVNFQDFLHRVDGVDPAIDGVVLRNLILFPVADKPAGHGIDMNHVTNSVIDGVKVGMSRNNGIFLDANSSGNVVMNCTVQGTVEQHAIAIKNSSNNQILNNAVTGSGFHGIFVLTGSYNRIEGNSVSGHQHDGITLTNNSNFNYIGTNTIVSNGFDAGRGDGTGVFLNSESNDNYVFGNDIYGEAEGGIAVFKCSRNVVEGNTVAHSNKGGIHVYNNNEGSLSQGNRPDGNVVIRNYVHDIKNNAGLLVWDSTNTEVAYNFVSGTEVAGATAGGISVLGSTNVDVHNNTFVDVKNALVVDTTVNGVNIATSGVTFTRNRFVNATDKYAIVPPANVAWHKGDALGGNFWSDNPSNTPYNNFIFSKTSPLRGGGHVDMYPFASETFGQTPAVTISDPAPGTLIAPGSIRTIRWASTGSSRVDIAYTSGGVTTAIASDQPDTGVFVWKVPANLGAGTDYVITVTPNDSAGNASGAAASTQALTVTAPGVIYLNPGPFYRTNGGQALRVAWKGAGVPVDIDIQTAPGGAFTSLATNQTKGFADVTLPAGASNQARIRVRNAQANQGDTSAAPFSLQGTAGITDVTAGENFVAGTVRTFGWTSPAGSFAVDLAYSNGGEFTTFATGIPDTGSHTMLVPDAVGDNATIRVTFHDAAGNAIGSTTSAAFSITASRLPTPPAVPPPPGGGTGGDNAPDLVAGAFAAKLVAAPAPLAKVSGTLAITNNGNLAINKVVPVGIYLSSTPELVSGAQPFTTVAAKVALKAKTGKATALKFALPASLPTSDYYLIAKIDPDGTLGESSVSNNTATRSPALQAPRVDLSVAYAGPVGAVSAAGKPAKVSLLIRNNGNVQASASSLLQFFQSADQTFDANVDKAITGQIGTKLVLKPNQSKKVSVTLKPAAGSYDAGSAYLLARLSPNTNPADDNAANDAVFSSSQVTFA